MCLKSLFKIELLFGAHQAPINKAQRLELPVKTEYTCTCLTRAEALVTNINYSAVFVFTKKHWIFSIYLLATSH